MKSSFILRVELSEADLSISSILLFTGCSFCVQDGIPCAETFERAAPAMVGASVGSRFRWGLLQYYPESCPTCVLESVTSIQGDSEGDFSGSRFVDHHEGLHCTGLSMVILICLFKPKVLNIPPNLPSRRSSRAGAKSSKVTLSLRGHVRFQICADLKGILLYLWNRHVRASIGPIHEHVRFFPRTKMTPYSIYSAQETYSLSGARIIHSLIRRIDMCDPWSARFVKGIHLPGVPRKITYSSIEWACETFIVLGIFTLLNLRLVCENFKSARFTTILMVLRHT